jgi:hypothetical protein
MSSLLSHETVMARPATGRSKLIRLQSPWQGLSIPICSLQSSCEASAKHVLQEFTQAGQNEDLGPGPLVVKKERVQLLQEIH